jgi:hypothetical protein
MSYINLISAIGVPNQIRPNRKLRPEEFTEALTLAERNKIPLLFLNSVKGYMRHKTVEEGHARYSERHIRTLETIATISEILDGQGLNYTFFKTLKPFPFTPSDVDVLFRTEAELKDAEALLIAEGLKPLDRDQYGLTLYHPTLNMNVDMTSQVAVAGLVYVDKALLFGHVKTITLNGQKVITLSPEADLPVIAAHSLYKEQIYNLSDFYTFTIQPDLLRRSYEISKELKVSYALELALKLTYNITLRAFGPENRVAHELSSICGAEEPSFSISRVPFKYPPKPVMKAIFKKLMEDHATRSSLPKAIRNSVRPKFVGQLWNHMVRKGY